MLLIILEGLEVSFWLFTRLGLEYLKFLTMYFDDLPLLNVIKITICACQYIYIIRWKFIVIHDAVDIFVLTYGGADDFVVFSYHFLIVICVVHAVMKIISGQCVVPYQATKPSININWFIDLHLIERH